MEARTKTIISIAQWIISSLAIPSLVWAWNLSTTVKVQEQQIQSLQIQVQKSETHAIQLATLNANLSNLKESISELKEMLRD